MATDVHLADKRAAQAWQELLKKFPLTQEQQKKIWLFYELLSIWNERINLTALVEPAPFIYYHVMDSLAVEQLIDFQQVQGLIDVGTGAGFPGIPLSICHQNTQFILIEVAHKKRAFLQEVINQLQLCNVTLCELDWRTFLRKTDYSADYVCARASLEPEELVRMFKPSSPYKNAKLIYWASQQWQPSDVITPYITADIPYAVGNKKRRYIQLQNYEKK